MSTSLTARFSIYKMFTTFKGNLHIPFLTVNDLSGLCNNR